MYKNEKCKQKYCINPKIPKKVFHMPFFRKTGLLCDLYTKLFTLSTEKGEKSDPLLRKIETGVLCISDKTAGFI